MNKKNKNILTLVLALTAAISGGAALSTAIPVKVNAVVFKDTPAVTVQNDYVLDQSLLTDARKGVLITANQSGSSIDFASSMSGVFELDLRVLSNEKPTAEDLKNSKYYPTLNLSSFALTFTDALDSSNVFKLAVDGTTALGAIPTAHVEANGESMGIFRLARSYHSAYGINHDIGSSDADGYFNDYNVASNETKLANAGGRYSYLLDGSFANVSWYKGGYVYGADSTVIGFDPVTMEVYGYSRGNKIVIWDLDEQVNDGYDIGFTLDGFEKYNVSFEFTALAQGAQSASVLVYSVNGQEVGSSSDTAAPSIYAKTSDRGIVGKKYEIAAPTAFDFIDGYIDTVRVSVTNPKGASVALDGVSGGTWANGASFIPTVKGEYTVKYSATDNSGKIGVLTQKVNVLEKLPKSAFVFKNQPENTKVAVGSSLYLELPEVINSYYGADEVNLTVKKGGSELLSDVITSGTTFEFAASGVYEIIYTAVKTGDTFSYKVTADELLPLFVFSTEWSESYSVGTRLAVPTGTATLAGETVNASVVVEYPNGTRFANPTIELKESGKYTAVYTAVINGAAYVCEKQFLATETAGSLFTSVSETEIYGVAVGFYNDKEVGLNMCSAIGGKVQYNNVINFTNNTSDDIFFEFKMTPKVRDEAEARTVRVTLTDTVNKMNYVQIEINRDLDMDGFSDVRSSAYGQPCKGLRGTTVYPTYPWGTMVTHSFMRNCDSLALSIDYATKCVYANGALVIDLDSSEYFTKTWEGFTNGLATLTFEIVEGHKSKVNYMVLVADGVRFTNDIAVDAEAPMINVDTLGYDEKDLPFAVVGKPYSIFSAIAYDRHDGAVDLATSAYYLLNGTKCEVAITNGTFTPSAQKDYYIDYLATDAMGNKAIKSLKIPVVSKDNFNASIEKNTGSGLTGHLITLPKAVASGQSGSAKISVSVKKPDGTTEAVIDNYLPISDGKYEFTYTVIDYLNREITLTYSYTANRNDKPVIDPVILPEAAVQGETLVIPNATVYDYTSGDQVVKQALIKVLYNGGEFEVANNAFVPAIMSADGTLTVKYYITANGVTSESCYVLKAVRVSDGKNNVDLSKLFYGDGFTLANTENIIYYTQTDGATLSFTRPIVAGEVQFSYGVPAGYANLNELTFTFKDSKNPEVAFAVKVRASGSGAVLEVVNDTVQYQISGSFGGELADFELLYDDTTGVLSARTERGLSELCKVKYGVDGKMFSGFESGLVNVSVTLGGVTGKAGVTFGGINNVSLDKSVQADRTVPLIYVMGGLEQYAFKGDKITLPAAVASDVLSSVEVKLIAYDPNDNVLYEGVCGGAREISIDVYGTYLFRYVATDAVGRSIRVNYFVDCVYTGEVSVKLNGSVPAKAKLNEKVILPSFTASNGLYSDIQEKYIILIDPNNTIKVLTGNEFTANKKGKYTVRYYAIDEYANTVIKDYTVTVD